MFVGATPLALLIWGGLYLIIDTHTHTHPLFVLNFVSNFKFAHVNSRLKKGFVKILYSQNVYFWQKNMHKLLNKNLNQPFGQKSKLFQI